MQKKELLKENTQVVDKPQDADFAGNNAAFTCPKCNHVYIVSGLIHNGKRTCQCGESTAYIEGNKAWITW